LRQDWPFFQQRGAHLVVICPEWFKTVQRFWEQEALPFPGVADPDHRIARLYGQEVSLLKLGRMPALFLVDGAGSIRWLHYASWQSDIPPTEVLLAALNSLGPDGGGGAAQ
jgi:peroxiredoxin